MAAGTKRKVAARTECQLRVRSTSSSKGCVACSLVGGGVGGVAEPLNPLFLSKLDALREGQLPAVVDRAAERNKPFISNMGGHAILRILEWYHVWRVMYCFHASLPDSRPLPVSFSPPGHHHGYWLGRHIPLATALTKCTTDLCPVGWDIHVDNAAVRSAWSFTPKLTELHAISLFGTKLTRST